MIGLKREKMLSRDYSYMPSCAKFAEAQCPFSFYVNGADSCQALKFFKFLSKQMTATRNCLFKNQPVEQQD